MATGTSSASSQARLAMQISVEQEHTPLLCTQLMGTEPGPVAPDTLSLPRKGLSESWASPTYHGIRQQKQQAARRG